MIVAQKAAAASQIFATKNRASHMIARNVNRCWGRVLAVPLVALTLALSACGEGGTVTSPLSGATPTPSPTPTPTPTNSTGQATAAATTIDFDNLLNYVAPQLPAYYDATLDPLDNVPVNNPTNNRIATLGRVLFYDRALSVNRAVSCAACHQQAFGFDDPARFSTGFSGAAFTTAHATRLGNVRYWAPGTMFWDRRAATLELQASQPITNPIEMGWDNAAGGMPALVARLQGMAYYQELFTFAYGDATVTETRLQRALANFQRAMIASSSRWDTAFAPVFNPALPNRGLNQPFPAFTTQEERGHQLFMTPRADGGAGCSGCHQPPTFGLAANSRSNGLDAGETRIFKSPALKNVALSRFFMHDGRFSTLAQVVDFYDSGIQAGPALDNRLINNGQPQRLNLSAADKAALVAFMQTFTDTSLNTDPRFSSPFR